MKISGSRNRCGWSRQKDNSKLYHISIYTAKGAEERLEFTEEEALQIKELINELDLPKSSTSSTDKKL